MIRDEARMRPMAEFQPSGFQHRCGTPWVRAWLSLVTSIGHKRRQL